MNYEASRAEPKANGCQKTTASDAFEELGQLLRQLFNSNSDSTIGLGAAGLAVAASPDYRSRRCYMLDRLAKFELHLLTTSPVATSPDDRCTMVVFRMAVQCEGVIVGSLLVYAESSIKKRRDSKSSPSDCQRPWHS